MKKLWLSLCSLLLSGQLWSSEFPISSELEELLEITEVHCERTLPKIVEATNKAWLRPANKERWQVEEKFDSSIQEKIVLICERMGMLAERSPQGQHYHYCCIFGATLPTVLKRLEFAVELWKGGTQFQEIVLLTGDRDLDEKVDRVPFLTALPKNETEAVKALYAAAPLPEGFRSLPVKVIAAPKMIRGDRWVRPGTFETITAWIKQSSQLGSVLFISNQPYICYQDAVVRSALTQPITFEVVGPKADQAYFLRASLLLDTIARWLYQENLLKSLRDQ